MSGNQNIVNQAILDSKKTIDNFLKYVKEQINLNRFKTKEELLEFIGDFNTSFKATRKTEEIDLHQFDEEIEKILAEYDLKSTNANQNGYENFKTFQRQNGDQGATMKIGKEDYTLKQFGDKNIYHEINDLYNEKAAKNFDEPPKDTIENNFMLLKKHVNEEIVMKPSGTFESSASILTPEKKALEIFAEKNNLKMIFSKDGLAKDQNGNLYEGVVTSSGHIVIYKVKNTTIKNGNEITEEKSEISVITPNELADKTNEINEEQINVELLAYLRTHLDNDGYKAVLNDPSLRLTEMEKQKYEQILEPEARQRREATKTADRLKKQVPEKVLVYKKDDPKHGRNGFVNALLLSLITSLFGTLCLAHFFTRIFN